MNRTIAQSHPEELQDFLNYLQKEYYQQIEDRTELVSKDIESLQNNKLAVGLVNYLNTCSELLAAVGQYLKVRRVSLAPYISELLNKEDEGHDCRSCSSNCTIQHTMQITDVMEGQQKIKDVLYKLQKAELPLYKDEAQVPEYRSLRSDLVLLGNLLTEVFYLEEGKLIPKIQEVQKNIYAHN